MLKISETAISPKIIHSVMLFLLNIFIVLIISQFTLNVNVQKTLLFIGALLKNIRFVFISTSF